MKRNWLQKNWETLKVWGIALLLALILSIQF